MILFIVIIALLAAAPVLTVVLFRQIHLERRQKTLIDDLKKVNGEDTPLVRGWGGASGIENEIAAYFSKAAVLPPAILLTVFYVFGFFLSLLYLDAQHHTLPEIFAPPHPLALPFAADSRGLVFAFLGVYLFNLGTSVRRIYLYDLSENLFWGHINRLAITGGLALVLQTAVPAKALVGVAFFSIGFLADTVLADLLKRAASYFKIAARRQTSELPLEMVQGLDMWKEYRLQEEGIENIQNLATADVIELAMRTHYSLRTLVDWIDQAILIARLRGKIDSLLESGVAISAIEVAWRASDSGGDPAVLAEIAQIAGLNRIILATWRMLCIKTTT